MQEVPQFHVNRQCREATEGQQLGCRYMERNENECKWPVLNLRVAYSGQYRSQFANLHG
jgi:hypothetical protein